MSQSIPFAFSAAAFSALQALEADGVKIVDNPTSPAQLADGDRVIFIEDAEDDWTDQAGQAEARAFGLTIGVINRTGESRPGADADMQAAKAIVADALRAKAKDLQVARDIVTFAAPREGRRTYRHEHIDVGGALILTRYSIQYRLPATRG